MRKTRAYWLGTRLRASRYGAARLAPRTPAPRTSHQAVTCPVTPPWESGCMKTQPMPVTAAIANQDWLAFPGGELEGRRPRTLCARCRANLAKRAVCFECFRADQRRERALVAARDFDSASEARFQAALPFEPVNRARLAQLKAERSKARVEAKSGVG